MKKVVAIVFVLALLGLIGYRITLNKANQAAVASRSQEVVIPSVSVEAVANRQLIPKVVITGNIRPHNEVDIVSRASGRIISVKFRVGDKVKKGDVLALVEQDIAVQQVKQARGALEAARANLMNAQRSNQSAEALGKESSIAEVQLVGSRAGLKAAEAGVMQTEAAVALAEENLKNTRLTSPIDGVVTKKNVNEGMMVNPGAGPGSVLFQIQSLAELKLESNVDEREVKFVKAGQPVSFEVDAWPGEKFTGKVTVISPSLDSATRRAAIEIAVDNAAGKLFANMFAQGQLLPSESRETLTIPKTALVRGKEIPQVYVIKDETAELRTIRVGETDGTYLAVLEGLTAGEQVVVSGQSRVVEGGKVQILTNTPAGDGSADNAAGGAQ